MVVAAAFTVERLRTTLAVAHAAAASIIIPRNK